MEKQTFVLSSVCLQSNVPQPLRCMLFEKLLNPKFARYLYVEIASF